MQRNVTKTGQALILSVTGLLALTASAPAQSTDVDWKLYGFVTVSKTSGPSECFFDAKGTINAPDRHIRVWTKCLSQKELNDIDIGKTFQGKILRNAAEKVAGGYVPPLALTRRDIDLDRMVTIITHEEAASIALLQPQS